MEPEEAWVLGENHLYWFIILERPCDHFLNDRIIFASLPQGPLSLMEADLNMVYGSATCFQDAQRYAVAAFKEPTMRGEGW